MSPTHGSELSPLRQRPQAPRCSFRAGDTSVVRLEMRVPVLPIRRAVAMVRSSLDTQPPVATPSIALPFDLRLDHSVVAARRVHTMLRRPIRIPDPHVAGERGRDGPQPVMQFNPVMSPVRARARLPTLRDRVHVRRAHRHSCRTPCRVEMLGPDPVWSTAELDRAHSLASADRPDHVGQLQFSRPLIAVRAMGHRSRGSRIASIKRRCFPSVRSWVGRDPAPLGRRGVPPER